MKNNVGCSCHFQTYQRLTSVVITTNEKWLKTREGYHMYNNIVVQAVTANHVLYLWHRQTGEKNCHYIEQKWGVSLRPRSKAQFFCVLFAKYLTGLRTKSQIWVDGGGIKQGA